MTDQPFQVMPPLSAEEYETLRRDITERGIVLVPVVKDQHGRTLDGHHRMQIANEIGMTYRVDVVQVRDDDEARSLARMYNIARRNLTREQKRKLIADEISADPERSDRAIARLLGCDHKTVGSVRRELSGELPQSKPRAGLTERIGFYRIHPALAIFPWVDDDVFAGIVDSIARHGLISPIMLTHDRKTMVDGRIRYRACEVAGVEPRFETLPERYTELMILDYIVSMNGARTHLTPDQRAVIEADRGDTEPMTHEEAEHATNAIRNGIEDMAQLTAELITKGVSRPAVAATLMEVERQAFEQAPEVFSDPEIRVAAHDLLIAPLIQQMTKE